MSETKRELIASASSGLAAKLVGFPFDLVKVRMQTNPTGYKGAWDCFKGAINERGIKSLYSGVTFPLAISESVVVFGTYSIIQKKLPSEYISLSPIISGAASGATSSFVLTPLELIKCRMQIKNHYNSAFDCFKQTVTTPKPLRALYKGLIPTLLREIPGNAVYFGLYEFGCNCLKPALETPHMSSRLGLDTKSDIPTWKLASMGSIAGIGYWSLFYPIDTWKSNEQTNQTNKNTKYKPKNILNLYRGLQITLIRAIPTNFTVFYVYEHLKRRFQ